MRKGIAALAVAALLCGCAQEGLTLEDPQDPRFVPPGTVVRAPAAGTEPVAAPIVPQDEGSSVEARTAVASLALAAGAIHLTAYRAHSANFALRGFSEVRG